MEIWLKLDDKNIEDFRFPVVPNNYEFEDSNIVKTSNITALGEVSFYGGDNTGSIELISFFPDKYYPFCSYSDFPSPLECVRYIKKLMKLKKPVRLIYTDTDINTLVLIESFKHGRKGGPKDIGFTINFKEFRKIDIPKVNQNTSDSSHQNNNSRPNNTTNTAQQVHIVKKGDNLWDISQKYLGKGSLYKKISEANWNTYPTLKKSNVIYPKWKLVIPKVL